MLCGLENYMMSEIYSKLIMDNDFNKLVYYKNENGDILNLPDLENPFVQLNNQVFQNRRPSKVLEEQDVCVFIYLDDFRNKPTNRKIKTVWIKVGFIVHEQCSKTSNGVREVALISSIQDVIKKSNFQSAIGKCKVERPTKLNGLPFNWNGYEIAIKLDGWV